MSFPLYFLDPLLEVFCDVGDLVLDVLTSEWLGFLVCSECFIVLIVFVILIVQSTRSAMFQIHTRNTRSRSIDAATAAAGDFSGNLALERKNVRFNSTVEYVQGGIIGDPKMSLPADDEEGGASTKTPELNKGEQECDFESVDVVVGGEDGLGKDVDVEEENGSGLGGGGGSFRKRSAAEMFQSIGLGPLCVKKKTSFGRVAEERMGDLIRKHHPFYKLHVNIGYGEDLLAMDRGGTSDPYVKCMLDQEKLFQTRVISKNINPKWDESFDYFLDNPFKPLTFQVFDHDLVGSDDYMGEADVELLDLKLRETQDLALELNDGDNEELIKKNKKLNKPLGSIHVKISLTPLTKEEMNEMLRSEKLSGKSASLAAAAVTGKGKPQAWSAVVHVVMVQARGLTAMEDGETSNPYCKLQLGKEKNKTKNIPHTVNPKWREGFNLYWYEEYDDYLAITILDRDIGSKSKEGFMGRVRINLRELPLEVTNNLWCDVENGDGRLNVIVTITGTTRGDSPSNLDNWDMECLPKLQEQYLERYKLKNTFRKLKDVGHLMVKVFRAEGLHAADIGGKSDPFAVLELTNDRVQTSTEYKTLAPTWQKIFQFDVKDVHDILEVTVFDENKDHKYEFLGRVKIPLLKIKNGERKWYTLKDKKLRKQAKGENPQIEMEMFFIYNKIRASIRTFNPKQMKYEDKSEPKFKHSLFMKNVNRVKAALSDFDPEPVIAEVQSILGWESKIKSAGAFVLFLLGAYFIELWMVTLGLLIPFIKNIIVLSVTGGWENLNEVYEDEEDDSDETNNATASSSADSKGGKDKEKSLKEKMQAIQDITLMVQNILGAVAHVLESVKNVFNFSVPFLSLLAFASLSVVTLVLYFVPLRYLIIIGGINKFTKKILRPNASNNNELADFISRAPDNEELLDYRELQVGDETLKKTITKKKPPADDEII